MLGLLAILYLVLVTTMTRTFLNEVYLIIFSYIILASFFGIEVLVVLHSQDPRSAAAGVWCTMFFIYMTYTLLALHIQECTISGVLLAVTQIACAAGLNYDDPFIGKQVRKKYFELYFDLLLHCTNKKWGNRRHDIKKLFFCEKC